MRLIYIIFILSITISNLFSKDYTNNIRIGFSNTSIYKDSGNGLSLAYGLSKEINNSLYYSILFNYEQTKINNISIHSFGSDMNFGYKFFDKLTGYLIASALTQDKESRTAYGFGYGIGIKYHINKEYALSLNHKIYDLTNSLRDYEYKSINMNLIYKF